MSALNKGQRIADRYVLLSRLAAGIHAEVWLGQDRESLTRVVIKLANLDAESGPVARRLLANEYDVGRRFNHPSIVRYYDFHDDESLCFLTQEYLPDGKLGALAQRPWHQFLPCVAELCDALAHVHEKGFVHRDVKLANALFADNGRVKLIDFGVATVAGPDGLRSGGSDRTRSPEQRDGAAPAASDDVYALGALLTELLTGAPPGGAAPDSKQTVPSALSDRVAQMLATDPARRPTDLTVLAREFEDLVDADPNTTLPPDEFEEPVPAAASFDLIEPQDVDAVTATPAATETEARRGVSRAVGVFAIWYLVIGAAAVFYYLPRLAPEVSAAVGLPAPSAAPTAGRAEASRSEPAIEPWKLAQMARTQRLAEERLEQLLEKQFFLDDKRVDVWAADEYAQARDAAIEGDGAFRQKDYDAALAAYTQGDDVLAELVARSEDLLGENLRVGETRIEEGNAVAAREHFELVRKIEPGNTRAKNGLARAERLDEVLTLVEEGRKLEQAGAKNEALAAYRKALAIDGEWAAAKKGASRMNRALAGSRFNAVMSDGFAALEAGRFPTANAAFDRAEKMRPGSAEVAEGRAQLAFQMRSSSVGALQAEAEALERDERYAQAIEKYRAALALDANLGFARDGVRRLTRRIELQERMAAYLADPDRLANDSVYQSASAALDEARTAPQPWSTLDAQIAELEKTMAASRVTSLVRLVSDNQTDVLVYRVGKLGRFEQTDLELRPGTYTAVGSRAGFRDVRREFRISPDGDTPVVEVRCEERI